MAEDTQLYECMYILDIEQEEDEMRAAVDAVEAVIEEEDGEVKETLQYGRRPLAYNIGQHTEGLYIITYFEGEGNVVRALNNEFRTLETIIRGIVVVANPKAIYKSERAKPSKEEAEAAEEAEIAEEAEVPEQAEAPEIIAETEEEPQPAAAEGEEETAAEEDVEAEESEEAPEAEEEAEEDAEDAEAEEDAEDAEAEEDAEDAEVDEEAEEDGDATVTENTADEE